MRSFTEATEGPGTCKDSTHALALRQFVPKVMTCKLTFVDSSVLASAFVDEARTLRPDRTATDASMLVFPVHRYSCSYRFAIDCSIGQFRAWTQCNLGTLIIRTKLW